MTTEQREAKRRRDAASKRRTRAAAKGVQVPPAAPARTTARKGRPNLPVGAEMPDTREGLCATSGEDPDLWFSDNPEDRALAIEYCQVCPVRAACLQYAEDTKPRFGVWGGVDRENLPPKKASAA